MSGSRPRARGAMPNASRGLTSRKAQCTGAERKRPCLADTLPRNHRPKPRVSAWRAVETLRARLERSTFLNPPKVGNPMNSMVVNAQWSSRPSDQRFLSLDDLYASVLQRRKECRQLDVALD